jgi:hypothetical protein
MHITIAASTRLLRALTWAGNGIHNLDFGCGISTKDLREHGREYHLDGRKFLLARIALFDRREFAYVVDYALTVPERYGGVGVIEFIAHAHFKILLEAFRVGLHGVEPAGNQSEYEDGSIESSELIVRFR